MIFRYNTLCWTNTVFYKKWFTDFFIHFRSTGVVFPTFFYFTKKYVLMNLSFTTKTRKHTACNFVMANHWWHPNIRWTSIKNNHEFLGLRWTDVDFAGVGQLNILYKYSILKLNYYFTTIKMCRHSHLSNFANFPLAKNFYRIFFQIPNFDPSCSLVL